MAFISTDDGYLTVFNIFETDTPGRQDGLLTAMREIMDTADYPGWISSTLHSGQDELGTANYIQWRSREDLEARYAGQKFKKQTVPKFHELATSVRLLKTEVVFTQHHPSLGGAIEISPDRDDYTVIIVFGVEPENQAELVDTLAQPDEWLLTIPGYRSHTYLRGIDGTTVVNYAQWDSKERYDAFHLLPEDERPADIQKQRVVARSLVTSRQANTYRVVHATAASDPDAGADTESAARA
jgi:heme-degrading monooxygenase HmoA